MDISKIRYISYRGYAKDCNYSCSYCPFVKEKQASSEIFNKENLDKDEKYLNKFVNFIKNTKFENTVSILFTPYGEALTKSYYLKALAKLSQLNHIESVSCQTNASFVAKNFLSFLEQEKADFNKIALWASFHPSMITAEDFSNNINILSNKISLSVGCVDFIKNKDKIVLLSQLLLPSIYLWVNKAEGNFKRNNIQGIEIFDFSKIDPLYKFEKENFTCDINKCSAGIDSLFVKEDGKTFLCHTCKEKIGNIYEDFSTEIKRKSTGKCTCYLSYCYRTDINFPQSFHKQQRYFKYSH